MAVVPHIDLLAPSRFVNATTLELPKYRRCGMQVSVLRDRTAAAGDDDYVDFFEPPTDDVLIFRRLSFINGLLRRPFYGIGSAMLSCLPR
jgi:hypothetical protein